MGRLDFGDFHDHAKGSFDALGKVTIKSIKLEQLSLKGGSVDVDPKTMKVSAAVDYDRKKDYYLTGNFKFSSDLTFKPSIIYEQGEHKLTTDYSDISVKYQYKLPALGGSVTTKLADGLASDANFSTAIDGTYTAGFSATYDPSRSGLKKLSYGINAQRPSFWRNGSVSLTIDSPKWVNLGLSYRCCPPCDISAFFEKSLKAATFGFQYTSDCGAKLSGWTQLTPNWDALNLQKVIVGLQAKRNISGLDVTLGASTNPLSPAGKDAKFGLKVAL